jgi:hypothetical protein
MSKKFMLMFMKLSSIPLLMFFNLYSSQTFIVKEIEIVFFGEKSQSFTSRNARFDNQYTCIKL